MGAKSGTPLKLLRTILRSLQLASAAIILGIYSYFLASLSSNDLHIPTSARAVEGISGAAALVALLSLLCCALASKPFFALLALVLDVAFVAAYIYVAVANKNGAGTCNGYLDTPFGRGKSGDTANGDGFAALPSFHTACRLQTACLAIAIIAIFLYIFSLLTELALIRHNRKAKRFGPSPANNYTSGYGPSTGLFARLLGRNRNPDGDLAAAEENMLPKHTTPNDLGTTTTTTNDDNMSYAPGRQDTINTPYNNHTIYDNTSYSNTSYNPGTYDPDYLPPSGDIANTKLETGYGYAPAPPGVIGSGGHAPANSSPYQQGVTPPRDYRYDDGIYDRV